MSDLISREELLEKLEEHIEYKEFDYYQEEPLINMSFAQLEDIICSQPTVDAKPVVHAKWIYGKNHGDFVEAECSACKTMLLVKWYDKLSEYNYCQRCGARMDGE